MKFFIITVLYNERLTECETWMTLLQQARNRANCCVIVADNSTEEAVREANRCDAETMINRLSAETEPECTGMRYLDKQGSGCSRMRYLDMHGNAGLPAAYNRAVETAEKDTDSWFIFADQDTSFPADYLENVEKAAEAVAEKAAETESTLLLAPVVKSGSIYLSPCRQNGLRFVPCSEAELLQAPADKLYFINSGLAVSGSVFFRDGIRYNEELFLDFTDFDLENQIRQKHGHSRALVLQDMILSQRFSGTEKRTAEQDLKRYRQYVHDGTTFYMTWHPGKSASSILAGRGMKLACKHKDIRFLKRVE